MSVFAVDNSSYIRFLASFVRMTQETRIQPHKCLSALVHAYNTVEAH